MTDNRDNEKIVRLIFSPAITLLNRIGFTAKFTLLWIVSTLAIAIVAYSLFVSLNHTIHTSQRELQGLALIEPISRTVQLLQQHRGISAALFGGGEQMRKKFFGKNREVTEAFKILEEMLPASMSSSDRFRNILASWMPLRTEGLSWTAEENFAAHTRLIEQLHLFEGIIADDYALVLDAEVATYYLIDTTINELPDTLEHFGQLRAYGTSILAEKRINENQKNKLHSLIAQLNESLNHFSADIEKIGRYSQAVQKSLLAAHVGIVDSARQITGLVEADILTGSFVTPADVFLDMATTGIDNAYRQIYQVLLPVTKRLIETRIAKAENTLRLTIGLASLLLLLVIYISVSIYYAIISNIKMLARSARAFAEGDLSQRVKLGTHDELSQTGDSFNEMADGFNVMIKASKQAEEELRIAAVTFETQDGIVITDAHAVIQRVNHAFTKITGYTAEEAVGQNPSLLSSGRHDAAFYKAMWESIQQDGAWQGEIWNRRKNGEVYPERLSITAVKGDNGEITHYVATMHDISKRKQAEEQIKTLAFYDTLTQLPNRRLLDDRLRQVIALSKRNGCYSAVMFLDLDNFKMLNDAHGHGVGDLLLIEAAQRLTRCVREVDTVARFGGDEFVVVLSELNKDKVESASRASLIAEKIRAALEKPYVLKIQHEGEAETIVEHHSAASIGVVLFINHETTTENLLKYADTAMYQAKKAGRNQVRFYESKA